MTGRRVAMWAAVAVVGVFLLGSPAAQGQELGGAGTVQGTVTDPTGAVMAAVAVDLTHPVTGFSRSTTTDGAGHFMFRNIPPNTYRLAVTAQGFTTFEHDVDVRSAVPIDVPVALVLAGTTTSVNVVGHVDALLERDPTAHTDIDQSLMARLPLESSSGLNQVITLASPGVVSDSNGFFHPIGDHAQTQFSIDNQPVTDQQSRVYSNQISPDAVQSMEVISGVAPAEFGDKSSLVVHIVTKSGLDQPKPAGSISLGFGSFGSPSIDANVGAGSHTIGNFFSASGLRTDRFLDPPEFEALHDTGMSRSFFDRVDLHPTDRDTLHLNLQSARSSFDVPNTYEQAAAGQRQHQTINTINVAPGYSRVIGGTTLFTANGFIRRDQVRYMPSTDRFADTPGTVSQARELSNRGAKVDVAHTAGRHNIKFGGSIGGTRLHEAFTFGLTDAGANAPCLDASGAAVADPALVDVAQCRGAMTANPEFNPDVLPFDLSRGGALFAFDDAATIKEQAVYLQDDITWGSATVKVGLRGDRYDGLTSASLLQPRVGLSYAIPGSDTVVRASYGRTLETPYNENLLLSSSGIASALVGSGDPLQPGKRQQVEVGVQQAFGRWVVVDLGYFHKHTDNAYDFGVLFDTPIVFPVSWDHSTISGVTGRVNLVQHRGLSAFTVFGHTSAIFSPPGNGGILLEEADADFRIDHDQRFQQTTNLQYAFNAAHGAWAAFSWRYDSGLVAGSVPDYATALTLSADQQAAIGLFCGGAVATRDMPITNCDSDTRGATRLRIPADGTADDVANPPRIAPRNLFDLGLGVDNLLGGARTKVRVHFNVVNIANKEALYNFLSTFSGTHFVTPRSYQVQVGIGF